MPVRTRSRTRAEEKRIEELAAKQLIALSLTHPDHILLLLPLCIQIDLLHPPRKNQGKRILMLLLLSQAACLK